MDLNEILTKFNNVKRKNDTEYLCRCPVHDDKTNSLSVSAGADGKILMHCHAGCSTETVLEAAGLVLADLFPDKKSLVQNKTISTVYQYRDIAGAVRHETLRYQPKGFTQRAPDNKGGYIYSLKGVETIIYNLQNVEKAISTGETVFIVEGEKDATNMGKLGLTATTSPMGAGKWQDNYSDYLVNAIVAIIPDNDTIGKSHSEQVAKSLKGKAKSIKIVDLTKGLPELLEKGDITDFFKTLGKSKGLEVLKRLVDEAPEWESQNDDKPQQEGLHRGQDNELKTIDSKTLSDMALEPIRYVITSTISVGLHLLAGAPKLGKSWLIIWLCLQIARGRKVWGQETTQGTTLYLCLEDNLNRIQSRMNIILNGEEAPNNVHFATMAKSINDGLIEQIDNWMMLYPDTRFIAIDTLQRIRGQHRSDNAYANDYQDAGQLKQLADKHKIAILIVHHLRKMLDSDVFNMVSGSTGLTGCVDSTFILKKEDRQSQEGTLYATGRDIEETELLLNFNKSICTWELISTNAEAFKEEKEFSENPLVIAVMKMLTDNPYWNGKALDLLDRLDKYSDDELPPTPNTLTRKLNELKTKLYKRNIKYFSNKKSSGTFITLEHISPLSPLSPQTHEAGTLQGNNNITMVSPLSPLPNDCRNESINEEDDNDNSDAVVKLSDYLKGTI